MPVYVEWPILTEGKRAWGTGLAAQAAQLILESVSVGSVSGVQKKPTARGERMEGYQKVLTSNRKSTLHFKVNGNIAHTTCNGISPLLATLVLRPLPIFHFSSLITKVA